MGNFVEMKKRVLGEGRKGCDVRYIGDGEVGSDVKVGCGWIRVNYDGKKKLLRKIEDGGFIGCN
ncbi:hypothetical protein [Bacillus pumilus]|uniref:hypothetical protein n=1 Tax=Bacillus pumilus TaxID=1408 RepID=UPI0011AA7793